MTPADRIAQLTAELAEERRERDNARLAADGASNDADQAGIAHERTKAELRDLLQVRNGLMAANERAAWERDAAEARERASDEKMLKAMDAAHASRVNELAAQERERDAQADIAALDGIAKRYAETNETLVELSKASTAALEMAQAEAAAMRETMKCAVCRRGEIRLACRQCGPVCNACSEEWQCRGCGACCSKLPDAGRALAERVTLWRELEKEMRTATKGKSLKQLLRILQGIGRDDHLLRVLSILYKLEDLAALDAKEQTKMIEASMSTCRNCQVDYDTADLSEFTRHMRGGCMKAVSESLRLQLAVTRAALARCIDALADARLPKIPSGVSPPLMDNFVVGHNSRIDEALDDPDIELATRVEAAREAVIQAARPFANCGSTTTGPGVVLRDSIAALDALMKGD